MAYLPWEVFVSEDGRTAEGYVNGPEVAHQFETLARGFADGASPARTSSNPWIQGRDFIAEGQLAMVITDYLGLGTLENAGIDYGTTGPPTPEGYDPYFFAWSDVSTRA